MGDPWRPESRGTAHGRNRQASKPPVVPGEAVAFLEGSEFAASFTVHPGKPTEVHRASGPAPGLPQIDGNGKVEATWRAPVKLWGCRDDGFITTSRSERRLEKVSFSFLLGSTQTANRPRVS